VEEVKLRRGGALQLRSLLGEIMRLAQCIRQGFNRTLSGEVRDYQVAK
jgi:hypothetical protein